VAQMVGVHHAGMECFRRAMIEGQSFEEREQNRKYAVKLPGVYSRQVEALDRHREKRERDVTVKEEPTPEEERARAKAELHEIFGPYLKAQAEDSAARAAEEEQHTRSSPPGLNDGPGTYPGDAPGFSSSMPAERGLPATSVSERTFALPEPSPKPPREVRHRRAISHWAA
jgi:hypothetical protein